MIGYSDKRSAHLHEPFQNLNMLSLSIVSTVTMNADFCASSSDFSEMLFHHGALLIIALVAFAFDASVHALLGLNLRVPVDGLATLSPFAYTPFAVSGHIVTPYPCPSHSYNQKNGIKIRYNAIKPAIATSIETTSTTGKFLNIVLPAALGIYALARY